jgi:hypothetical protein
MMSIVFGTLILIVSLAISLGVLCGAKRAVKKVSEPQAQPLQQ